MGTESHIEMKSRNVWRVLSESFHWKITKMNEQIYQCPASNLCRIFFFIDFLQVIHAGLLRQGGGVCENE